MKPTRRSIRGIGALGLILLVLTVMNEASYGQKMEYPTKPIKIYVTTTPGGTADLWTRAWSEEFSKILKVPVTVVAEGGASGVIALTEASKAEPDGHTLTYVAQSNVVGFAISTQSPFDLFKDFVPIGSLGSTPTIILVEKSSPFMTFEDFISFAEKNPGKLKCGTAGVTVVSHFNFELLRYYGKLDISMIPFKGSPQALTALLGNHVDLIATLSAPVQGLIKAKRVRVLLTTRRTKNIPDVPLFSEKGFEKAAISGWSGLFAPSGIPQQIHAKLIDTFEKISKNPEVIKKIEALGFNDEYQPPAVLGRQMREDFEKIKAVAQKVGISQ